MKLPSILIALLAVALVLVGASVQAEDVAFPGQPHINGALKHLNAAKEKVSSDTASALSELEEAHKTMSHAIRKKGTYQPIAKELIEQAKEYLQKGDTEKATHKIDEAIATVTRAGETGDKQ